jgi:hypothetical protein
MPKRKHPHESKGTIFDHNGRFFFDDLLATSSWEILNISITEV